MSAHQTYRTVIPIRFADVVQVFVDLATGAPKAVPDSFRERVREFLAGTPVE